MTTIHHPRVFLSHESGDKVWVRELALALTRRGLVPWLDEDAIALGQSISHAISHAMSESAAFAVLLTKRSLASDWVGREVRQAMELEDDRSVPRARILPLLLGLDIDALRNDSRFDSWFVGKDLDRLYASGEGPIEAIGDQIATSVGLLMGFSKVKCLQLVCDARGPAGTLTGFDPPAQLDHYATVVLRPHRGPRSPAWTATGEDWERWREDMHSGLSAMLTGGSRLRRVRLHLRCQYALAVWLGARFDRQHDIEIEVYDHDLRDPSPWRSVAGSKRGLHPSKRLQVLREVQGQTITALVWDGSSSFSGRKAVKDWHAAHGDGPLVGWSYAPELVDGKLPPDLDVPAWANQLVADLVQRHPTHLRLVLACPVWAAVALGHLLTRVEVPSLSVLEWDAEAGTYGECRVR